MREPSEHDPDITDWIRSLGHWAWVNRPKLAPPVIAGLLAAGVGLGVHLLCVVADLKLARADLNDGWRVVRTLDAEAFALFDQAADHQTRRQETLDTLKQWKPDGSEAWVGWMQATADADRDLARIKFERAERLLCRTAEFRLLLTAAERELARARDARIHGHTVRVAPRVREVIAPVLALR